MRWGLRPPDFVAFDERRANERLASSDLVDPCRGMIRRSAPVPYIAEFTDAMVLSGSRVVLSRSGLALCDETDFAFRSFLSQPKRNDFGMAISEGPRLSIGMPIGPPERLAVGIHLTCEHEHNYFHWVTEVLPRLLLYEVVADEHRVPLLVTASLHPNLHWLLDLVRHPLRPVIHLTKGRVYHVQRLVYPSDVSRTMDVVAPGQESESVFLSQTMLAGVVSRIRSRLRSFGNGRNRKLFLLRTNSWRIPTNQDQIASIASQHGFEIVDAGTLSASEQIEIFSQAKAIVGPSGASLTNLVWCPQEARVLVLHADHRRVPFPFWEAVARVSGVEVSYLAGPRLHKRESDHDDFEISVKDFTRALDRLSA